VRLGAVKNNVKMDVADYPDNEFIIDTLDYSSEKSLEFTDSALTDN
jgi:hypothetical protein